MKYELQVYMYMYTYQYVHCNLLAIDPLSLFGYLTVSPTHPVTGNSPIKTLVARQQQTSIMYIHVQYTYVHLLEVAKQLHVRMKVLICRGIHTPLLPTTLALSSDSDKVTSYLNSSSLYLNILSHLFMYMYVYANFRSPAHSPSSI